MLFSPVRTERTVSRTKQQNPEGLKRMMYTVRGRYVLLSVVQSDFEYYHPVDGMLIQCRHPPCPTPPSLLLLGFSSCIPNNTLLVPTFTTGWGEAMTKTRPLTTSGLRKGAGKNEAERLGREEPPRVLLFILWAAIVFRLSTMK